MKMKNYKISPSRFFCTVCGKEGIPIQRKKGQERCGGHLKKLYCLYCNKETNHVEIKEYENKYTLEDFKQEFKLGRFIEGDRIAIDNLLICSCKTCPFNIDGRCWNANYSYDCSYRPKEADKYE